MGRVEAVLTAGYTTEKATPVIIKLTNRIVGKRQWRVFKN